VTALYINVTVLLEITQLQTFLIKLMLPASRYGVVGAAGSSLIFVPKRYSVIL